jgi:Predicted hydrolase (HAD superfamily)
MPPYDFVTFDCYGTLIDWRSGIATAFSGLPRFREQSLTAEAILDAYAEAERQVEEEGYRSYREVLTEASRRTARLLGVAIPPEKTSFLADSLPDWLPFPDTNAALESLRAKGVRLGILSNVDNDLLAATQTHFTVPFDLIMTAQQLRSYKPGPAHFLTARAAIGEARWIHAAQSNRHDIVPANALGIPTAWINRHGARPLTGGIPTHEFPDLRMFAAFMER